MATVSISAVMGEDGIIKRAELATEHQANATIKEKLEMSMIEDIINETETGIKVEKVTDTNPGVLEGSGTEVDPYVINSIEDLVFFAYDVRQGNKYEGKTVELGLSLDFNSTKSYVNPLRTDYEEYGYNGELKTLLTSGEGWIPIGSVNDSETNLEFYGTFDGNNHTISNLYMNREIKSGEVYQFYGLFAMNYGIVKNINVSANIRIISTKINIHVGSIVGINATDAIIENCASHGLVNVDGEKTAASTTYVAAGGISGMSRGEIVMCKNNATIIGDGSRIYLGGIVGSSYKGSVYKSYNIGKISLENYYGDMERAGGIAGNFERGTIDYCFNLGEINGTYSTGGSIVGVLQENASTVAIISNCAYNNSTMNGIGYYAKVEISGNYANDIIQEEMVKVQITKNEALTENDVLINITQDINI